MPVHAKSDILYKIKFTRWLKVNINKTISFFIVHALSHHRPRPRVFIFLIMTIKIPVSFEIFKISYSLVKQHIKRLGLTCILRNVSFREFKSHLIFRSKPKQPWKFAVSYLILGLCFESIPVLFLFLYFYFLKITNQLFLLVLHIYLHLAFLRFKHANDRTALKYA